MTRNPFPARAMLCLVLAASLLAPVPAISADEDTHGWRRSGTGFWGEEPAVHAGFSDNGIALEMTLPPGTGVSFGREGSWASDNASIRMSTDNVVPGKNEYHPGEAEFPASVTFVYGKDRLSISAWGRFKLFFTQLRNGFRPSGIRLTYAWGSRVPVGSMYRLWEEETVFILAGREESGKEISASRRLKRDFEAAYGRPPKGPVTQVLVEARRTSMAERPADSSITVRFPAD
jgi:hypothetical protein